MPAERDGCIHLVRSPQPAAPSRRRRRRLRVAQAPARRSRARATARIARCCTQRERVAAVVDVRRRGSLGRRGLAAPNAPSDSSVARARHANHEAPPTAPAEEAGGHAAGLVTPVRRATRASQSASGSRAAQRWRPPRHQPGRASTHVPRAPQRAAASRSAASREWRSSACAAGRSRRRCPATHAGGRRNVEHLRCMQQRTGRRRAGGPLNSALARC